MARFNALDFGYRIVEDNPIATSYQKILSSEVTGILDLIELGYYKNTDTWIIFIAGINLKRFLTDYVDIPNITLFMGKMKNDFDYRFIMSKVCKDPQAMIKAYI